MTPIFNIAGISYLLASQKPKNLFSISAVGGKQWGQVDPHRTIRKLDLESIGRNLGKTCLKPRNQ